MWQLRKIPHENWFSHLMHLGVKENFWVILRRTEIGTSCSIYIHSSLLVLPLFCYIGVFLMYVRYRTIQSILHILYGCFVRYLWCCSRKLISQLIGPILFFRRSPPNHPFLKRRFFSSRAKFSWKRLCQPCQSNPVLSFSLLHQKQIQ